MYDNWTRLGLDFLKTEAKAGNAFADIALGSADPSRAARNRVHARAAYGAIVRFRDRVAIAAEDGQELDEKVADLKYKLLQLGESV